MTPDIKIFSSPPELAESLALEFVEQIKEASTEVRPFTVAVSGGKTPRLFFSILGRNFAEEAIWRNLHLFWVDERCVPPWHNESNFGIVQEEFIDRSDISPSNIHRIRGEDDPQSEAERYENELRAFIEERDGFPAFDLILLGIGADGHTASIFPGNEGLFNSERLCVPAIHPVSGQTRITLTGSVINNAARIIFMVTGKSKADIVRNVIDPQTHIKEYPASFVIPASGRLSWYIDIEAGSLL